MTSDRPFRTALSAEAAFAELERERGRQFDPECVEAFVALRHQVVRQFCSRHATRLDPGPAADTTFQAGSLEDRQRPPG